MSTLINAAIALARQDDGSQVAEYGLVIALVSIVLALALNSAVTGIASTFVDLATRVASCLMPSAATC